MAEFHYWVRRCNSGILELRQQRFREQFNRGVDHPHDVCAYATTREELQRMLSLYLPGPVDWSEIDDETEEGSA